MSNITSKTNFWHGIFIALAISIVGGMVFGSLGLFFPVDMVLQMVIAVCGFLYVLYLLKTSKVSYGRFVVVMIWFMITIVSGLAISSLALNCVIHISMLWFIRALYHHDGLFTVGIDFLLMSFGVVAAIWAGLHSQSIFLTLWCFFLVQAFFPGLKNTLGRYSRQKNASDSTEKDSFLYAYHVAENALNKLSS